MGFLNGGTITGCRYGYFSDFGNNIPLIHPLTLCPNTPLTLNGVTYTQPAVVLDTIPGVQGCDTVITYLLQLAPLDLVFQSGAVACAGGHVNLDYTLCNLGSDPLPPLVPVAFYAGDPFAGPATYLGNLVVNTTGAADSCFSGVFTDAGAALGLYDGMSLYAVVNFDGSLPTPLDPGIFPVTGIEECNYTNNLDSAHVVLPAIPILDLGPDVILCHDSTVVFDAGPDFIQYLWNDGTSGPSLAASAPGLYWVEVEEACGFVQRDTVLLTLSLLGDTQLPDVALCAGDSLVVTLPGFDTYLWAPAAGLSCTDCASVLIGPDTTTAYTLLATTSAGCVLADTFTVEVLPWPTRAATIEFCAGDSVLLGGAYYSQPGTAVDTLTGTMGCDTVVTYTLQYPSAPNAQLSIDCPDDINIPTLPGTGAIPVDYNLPQVIGDCPCPGIALTLTEGLPPGSLFPMAKTNVCYTAEDSCGNTAACCFVVNVREALPCDVKEIGCMKYELLRITQNSQLERSYRIRVTNKCPNPMTYTAIELPDGITAVRPADNTVYTAMPSQRQYEVRNPNFTPFYSIRFKSIADSLANGASDVFEYTLPPQSQPVYIHVTSRLEPQVYYEAYLNTFNCPVLPEQKPAGPAGGGFRVFPNPVTGVLFADFSQWEGQRLRLQIRNAAGQPVLAHPVQAEAGVQEIRLPQHLPDGLYFLEIRAADGTVAALRFVLQR